MKAKRIDGNQHEIVAALRKIGASVAITSMVGNGFPDLVVGFQKRTIVLEIKRSKKEHLTPKEKEFHESWRGAIAIISSIDEAIDIVTKI